MLSADGFLDNQAVGADGKTAFINPLSPRKPHHQPKAKSVIFLFMYGGPSHIDTFDYKPQMIGMDGKTITVKTFGRGGKRNRGRVVEPRWKFQQYGECGKWVSSLFPNVAKHVDDIAFIHSMTADSPIRFSDVHDEFRQGPQRKSFPGIMGNLWAWHGQSKPAGLRGDAGQDRWSD
jgi:hypothetical protein